MVSTHTVQGAGRTFCLATCVGRPPTAFACCLCLLVCTCPKALSTLPVRSARPLPQVQNSVTDIQRDVRPLLVIKANLLSVPSLVRNVTALQKSCTSCSAVQTTITDVRPLLRIKDKLLQVRPELAGSHGASHPGPRQLRLRLKQCELRKQADVAVEARRGRLTQQMWTDLAPSTLSIVMPRAAAAVQALLQRWYRVELCHLRASRGHVAGPCSAKQRDASAEHQT